MNSKRERESINRNVWALTLSLCLGVIGFSTLGAQAAEERKGIATEVDGKPGPGHGPSLRCCECVGKTVVLDLRTGDPWWTVSPGSGPTKTALSAWTASAAPASWIQPVSPATATATNVPAGAYTYTVKFNVPKKCTIPYEKFTLTGTYAADNGAIVKLDTSPAGSCTPSPIATDKKCFTSPQPLSWSGTLIPGSHALTFDVTNQPNTYSGLLVNAKLTAECKK